MALSSSSCRKIMSVRSACSRAVRQFAYRTVNLARSLLTILAFVRREAAPRELLEEVWLWTEPRATLHALRLGSPILVCSRL